MLKSQQTRSPKPSLSPQEDLRALQVCARGARRPLGARPAGEDDDEAGVRLPETLHLRRRLGLRLRGVRMGPAWAQARTGNNQGVEQAGFMLHVHKASTRTCSHTHTPF